MPDPVVSMYHVVVLAGELNVGLSESGGPAPADIALKFQLPGPFWK